MNKITFRETKGNRFSVRVRNWSSLVSAEIKRRGIPFGDPESKAARKEVRKEVIAKIRAFEKQYEIGDFKRYPTLDKAEKVMASLPKDTPYIFYTSEHLGSIGF